MSNGSNGNEVNEGSVQRIEKRKYRLQIYLSSEAYERLLAIRQLAEAHTNVEVIRNALRLYEWFLEQKKEGYKFHLVKDEKALEVELMF